MVREYRWSVVLCVLVVFGLFVSSLSLAQGDVWPTYLHDARHTGRCPYVGPNGPFFGWSYSGLAGSSVTVGTDGTLRVCSRDGIAYSLNSDGTLRWTYVTGSAMRCTPPIASDGSIVFQGADDVTYRVDKDGGFIWSYNGTAGGPAITSPVIADELNMVFCLQGSRLHAIYMSGSSKGTAAWVQDFNDMMEFIDTSPAFDGDTVYVTGSEIVDGLSGALKAVEASTGTVKWTFPPSGPIDSVTKSSPSISDNGEFVYFGDDGDGDNEAVLYCVFASDGTLNWSWDSPVANAGILNAPAIGTDGTLYVVDTEKNLFAVASDGTLKWSVQLASDKPFEYASVIIDALGTIYVTANGGLFYGVSPQGRLCWAYDLGYDVNVYLSAASIGTTGTLYFCSFGGSTLHSVGTGNYLTNPGLDPECGSTATIFEFSVDCAFGSTVATLRTVQAHLDDGSTVDLHLESGSHWVGTVSSLSVGSYRHYFSYETAGGLTGTLPETGWFDGPVVDDTAPTSTCWCDSQCYTTSPILVNFASSDDLGGVTTVSLWYRRTPDCQGQHWWGDWTFLMSTTATVGAFSVPWSSEGRIEFCTIAEDCAGNKESKSSRDCWTIYDDTAPVTTVSSPECENRSQIRVDYVVDESCMFEPDVELWYRYEGGSWTFDQKEEGSGSQGYFNFFPKMGEGEYTFGCVSTDNCGNDEGTPGTVCTTIYDITIPTSEVADAPTYDTDGSFDVDVAADDPSTSPHMSGIYIIRLWYQYNGGSWQFYGSYTAGCTEHATGTIPFVASDGDGTYGFYTTAEDCCGNSEAEPTASTTPDKETIVDTVPPESRAISPDYANGAPVLVDYQAYDETSGVDYVKLYYNEDGGNWQLYTGYGNSQSGETGTFPFYFPIPKSCVLGFYTVAYDKAGLNEMLPDASTPPDSTTVYDDEVPTSAVLSCASASFGTLMPAGVAIDDFSGISQIRLYYRVGTSGSFGQYSSSPWLLYWITPVTEAGFQFTFVPPAGDGLYQFVTKAADAAGNWQPDFATPFTAFFDSTAPESRCWADDHYLNTTTVTLHYLATDTTTTVADAQLYYRFGQLGDFVATGSTLPGGSASVSGDTEFELQDGQGTYYFYTLARDELSNRELPPASPDWWVILDTTAPSSHCSSPQYASSLPIAVDFASQDSPSSGIEETGLYYRYNGGAWTDSGLREEGEFGTFYFSPAEGDGVYDFCTRALDRAGNLEDYPAEPDSTTVYDTTAPYSVCGCHSPANSAPVEIAYSAADDTSGLAKVCLWHRYSADGGITWTPDWTFTGMCKADAIGTFYYDPTFGDGLYEFYVVALDNAGIWEAKATRDTYCSYTGTAPTSRAEAGNYASQGTIDVAYTAYAPGSDVSDVTLWYRYEGGSWHEYDGDYGYATKGVIHFDMVPPHNEEGLYEFFTILQDTDGNVELAPPVPDTWCIYDITAPYSSVEAVGETSVSTLYIEYVADDPSQEGVTPSGLYSVTLWYSYEGGPWREYPDGTVYGSATSGTIIFELPPGSDGTIDFYTIAKDNAGNTEGVPTGPDDTSIYDGTAPESAALPLSPYYVSDPNIVVNFSASDNYSGVDYVELWYRYQGADSPWTFSGLKEYASTGSFSFVASEGVIEFYTIAVDNFGNVEAAPSQPDTSVCYDVTPPVSTITTVGFGATSFNESPVPIYYVASDSASGVLSVRLYYKYNGGSWQDSGSSQSQPSGTFYFNPPDGAGTYEFYTIATDNAGNVEQLPAGGSQTVLYDLEPPSSAATGPLYTNVPDIDVEYTATDDLSGVDAVWLWYRFGGGGWVPWLDDYGDSTAGTIAMTLAYGEGAYHIFSQAGDVAGNVEPKKSAADLVTVYDAQAPASECYCAEYTTSSPIEVRFGAVDEDSSGVYEVCLQYNFEGGGWTDSGLCQQAASGTFEFTPTEGPGTYQFRTIATDNSGNTETPGPADCSTFFDDETPQSSCQCATDSTAAPLSITFEATDPAGVIDTVTLWVRYSPDGGTTWTVGWQESGLYSENASGTFEFDPTFGDGLYEFYTIAEDTAGNTETAPSQRDCWTNYTASTPTSLATAPAVWNGPEIPVDYTAAAVSGSTIQTICLYWRRYVGPDYTSWHQYTGEYGTGTFGTIGFSVPVENALYEFYTRAIQHGGATESPPTQPDTFCLHDSQDPASQCSSEAYVEGVPIIVTFTATDSGSGIDDVALYYSFDGGGYIEYSDHRSGASGTFVFDPPSGQGTYRFYTIATDTAGNVEAPPASADSTTVWDVSKPSSVVTSAPAIVNTTDPITITFTSSDPVGNGVTLVSLWYNVNGGTWHHSGLEVVGTNILFGSLSFTPSDGDGLYGFYTIAKDNWGNVEDPPPAPDATTLLDTAAPWSYSYDTVSYTNATPVTIYFYASDGLGNVSGVDHTALWYRFNSGSWAYTGLTEPGDSGSYSFVPTHGDGRYEFYTLSVDNAGNAESPPGFADSWFYLDTVAPQSSCTSPYCTNTPTFSVDYTAYDTGPASVGAYLYYRYNGGAWIYWGAGEGESGTFTFVASQDGIYEFATRAWDQANNWEPFPSTSDSTTLYDSTPPSSTCQAPACASSLPIVVTFTSQDALTGVSSTALWFRANGGAWTFSGLTSPGTSGSFAFEGVNPSFEGTIEFYTISTDNCGNQESPPLVADTLTFKDTTAPESTCSAPSCVNEQVIPVDYIATDAVASVDHVELWYSANSQPYAKYGDYPGTSGTIDFSIEDGEGIYHFYTIGVDLCGNRETRPAYADAVVTYDKSAPSSTVSAPAYANSLPFTVSFAASDNLSGVASTVLYYRLNGGQWFQYGSALAGATGEFSFLPDDVEGVYEFYTVSTDVAGNVELGPLSAKASTVYDRSAPSSSCMSAAFATTLPIEISYSASDAGPAGLGRVALWFKLDTGPWQEYTGDYGTLPAGTILFDAPGGLEGTYYFYTLAEDKAGNVEPRPGQAGTPPIIDSKTVYDVTPPVSQASCSAYSNGAPIAVAFSAQDNASGIKRVSLWVKFGEGDWEDSGLFSSSPSGNFDFVPLLGEGTYYFYTIATDNAGHSEAAPDEPDATTVYDVTAPVTTLSAPPGASSLPLQIDFTCLETGSLIDTVLLFYRFNGGDWQSTGLSAHTQSGSFYFMPSEGPGTYDFYAVGIDKAGNEESAVGKLYTTVRYDITAPTSAASCASTVKATPIAVDYLASGTGSGVASVELFYNYEGMGWLSTGLVAGGAHGTFLFTPAEGDGRYEFYTQAIDDAGNVEYCSGTADCATFLDTVAPESLASAPSATSTSPIIVEFATTEAGIGVASVQLWCQFGNQSWEMVDEKAGVSHGAFEFVPTMGQGLYNFYTIARDLAGNVEAAPALPDATTAYDTSVPESQALVPAFATGPTVLVQYQAFDGFSGIASVSLWCRFEKQAWFDTGLFGTGTIGTLSVSLASGPGRYDFYTRAVDNAGNVEPIPAVPDGRCVFDATRPSSKAMSPLYTSMTPIIVRFEALDAQSGLQHVGLWYRFDDGQWANTGLIGFGPSGSFEFAPDHGEGRYEFYTIAVDNAGWEELAPSVADTTSYYDVTAPTSSVSSPDVVVEDTIPVFYTAWDTTSGLKVVELWYRFENRDWAKSGYFAYASSGTIEFIPPDGVGTYSFWTVATDNCGNSELPPTTGATVTAVTVFDNVAPRSSVSVSVDYTNESPILVSYEASDAGTGVSSVRLWYRVGGGAYKDAGLWATEATVGIFEFVPIEGDGVYDFYSVAKDNVGNQETPPETPDASVVFDTTAPFSSAVAPSEVHQPSITVGFSATDILSPITAVNLWYRYSPTLDGDWTDWVSTGATVAGQAGLFPFEATHGEGYYEFYTIAQDAAGNVEEAPAVADARTQYRILYPEISLSADSHDFGEVPIMTSSVWQLFVTNVGEAVLTIDRITVDNDAFEARVLTPISIDPEMSSIVPVIFAPLATGATTGIMTIYSNDPNAPQTEVELLGTGVEPGLKMSIELGSNGSVFYPGDVIHLTLSGSNDGEALSGLDLFVSVILPNGETLYLPKMTPEPVPLASDFDLPSGFSLEQSELFAATVDPGVSLGGYVWRAFLTRHNSAEELLASLPLVVTVDIRPKVQIWLDDRHAVYGRGDTQLLSVSFGNEGLAKTLDLYVALQTPDGRLLFVPTFSPTLSPCVDDLRLRAATSLGPVPLLHKSFGSFEPGRYRWLAALTDPDSVSLLSSVAEIEWELE